MDVFMKSAMPKTVRVSFYGPAGARKGEAFSAVPDLLPEGFSGTLDPFEINGTGMISLVISLAAIRPDVDVNDTLRMTSATGPIRSDMHMNRLLDRTDSVLFFAPNGGPETHAAWEQIEANFERKRITMIGMPVLFLVFPGYQNDQELVNWIKERKVPALEVDPSRKDWPVIVLRRIIDMVIAKREEDVHGDEEEMWIPPEEAVVREIKFGLLERVFAIGARD